MLEALARNWWAVALRGAIAVVIGIIAFVLPGITLASLVLLFAIYMLLDGVFAIIAGVRAATHGARWWPMALEGVVDIVAGAIALLWPIATVLAFVYLAAAWAIVSGVVLLAGAVRHREILLGIAALFSLAWGVFVALVPAGGALALVWVFGAYAILFGVALVVAAFRLRRFRPAARLGGAVSREAYAGGKPPIP
jgi:uncharacterized membrane protein HdeD (DUF308 family)